MAEAGEDALTVIKKITDSLACPICLQTLSQPTMLHCTHTFCRECLTQHVKNKLKVNRKLEIPCPYGCRGTKAANKHRQWTFDTRVKDIGINFAVQDIVDIIQSSKIITKEDDEFSRCEVHSKNEKFYCGDCKKITCSRCVIEKHRKCESVSLIKDQLESMRSELTNKMSRQEKIVTDYETEIVNLKSHQQCTIASFNKLKAEIEDQFEKCSNCISKRKLELLKEVETAQGHKLTDIQNKTDFVDQIKLKLRSEIEFINDTLMSNSSIQICNVYKSCDYIETQVKFLPTLNFVITFIRDDSFEAFKIGRLNISGTCNHGNSVLNTKDDSDDNSAKLFDILMMDVEDKEILIASDFSNLCLKSYSRILTAPTSRATCPPWIRQDILSLDGRPHCMSLFDKDTLMVSLLSKKIVHVSVRPHLHLVATINTNEQYSGLCVLNQFSLAAGRYRNVDILDMEGRVMRSLTSLFTFPDYININSDGDLLVSDFGKKSVTCITTKGRVIWEYKNALSGPMGITTTLKGDVLFVEIGTVIKITKLSASGRFLDCSAQTQKKLTGICVRGNCAFVCDSIGYVRHFSKV